MLKRAILKSFLHYQLAVVCSANHLTQGASTDKLPESELAGSENSEKSEFENCILLEGDINGEDPYLNNAINQLFMVSQA